MRTAVYTQRFSLLFVTLAGLLSLTPGAEILDQLPDVERAWVDPGKSSELWWGASVGVACALLFFALGRLRSDHILTRLRDPKREIENSNLKIWVGFALFFLLLGVAGQLLGWGPMLWDRFRWFGGVTFGIWLISRTLRWLNEQSKFAWWSAHSHCLKPKAKMQATARDVILTVLVGDVAAVAILAIGGLGVVRSFTAPVALAALVPGPESGYQVLALVVGVIVSLAVWPGFGWMIDGSRSGVPEPACRPAEPPSLPSLPACRACRACRACEPAEPADLPTC